MLAGLDIGIVVVKLDKHRLYTDLSDEPHVLYNSIVNILMNRLMTQHELEHGDALRLVASQRETKGVLNQRFIDYLVEHIKTPEGVSLNVEVKHPSAEKGLQAVDLLSWSYFRKIEHDDATYSDIVNDRLLEVSSVFG
jgi:hypothetical protein